MVLITNSSFRKWIMFSYLLVAPNWSKLAWALPKLPHQFCTNCFGWIFKNFKCAYFWNGSNNMSNHIKTHWWLHDSLSYNKIRNFVINNMLLHHIYTWQRTLELQEALNFHLKKNYTFLTIWMFFRCALYFPITTQTLSVKNFVLWKLKTLL